jgi:hypothetical protein
LPPLLLVLQLPSLLGLSSLSRLEVSYNQVGQLN